MTHPSSLYRAYIKHLRHIPDPHIWRTHLPYFRSLLDRPLCREETERDGEGKGETSRDGALKEARRLRGLIRAKRELNKLKAAVACHPHALRRLLEEAYARRGRLRWELINNIISFNRPPSPLSDASFPAPLLPLKPSPLKPNIAPSARLRPLPAAAIRKAAKRSSERDWQEVQVPLILPSNQDGWGTGWEGLGVLESLRILAGLEEVINDQTASQTESIGSPESPQPTPFLFPPPLVLARSLPSFSSLPPHIRLLLPHRRPPPMPRSQAHPSPPPAHTRPNPRTWGPVREFRPRLIRRMYRRLWDSLVWVKPGGSTGVEEQVARWKKVEWEGLLVDQAEAEAEGRKGRSKGEKKRVKEKKEWVGRTR